MFNICELEYADAIKSRWGKVFIENDPFRDSFVRSVESRLILYPTHGYHLAEDQYSALIAAVRAVGESGFYLSVVEHSGEFLKEGQHWLCKSPKYDQYLKIPLTLENCIYSEDGTFGILISHEDHALVGGEEQFIEVMKREYVTWKDDIAHIEKDWSASMSGPVLEAIR